MKNLTISAAILLGATIMQPSAYAAGEHSEGHDHMKMEMQQERIETSGTINSVDLENRKVNVSHEPIPALGWPSMTMDFAVADSVDLAALMIGKKVGLMLAKGGDGIYLIDEVMMSDVHNHSH